MNKNAMPEQNPTKTETEQLQSRVQFLEKSKQWYMFAMDVLLSMRDVYNDVKQGRNPATIFDNTRHYLERLHHWHSLAFFTINEQDNSFLLFDCLPTSDWEWIQQETDALINSGEFAWALNQQREVIYPAKLRPETSLVLHVLTTKTRIRGMFIGVPSEPIEHLPEGVLHLLSIILHHTAYVLESAELYHLLHEERDFLQHSLKTQIERLEYENSHDILTDLPNRIAAIVSIGQAVRTAMEHPQGKVAVIVIDVDDFRFINDSLGRECGDQILRILSSRLRQDLWNLASKATHIVGELSIARLGADEFCLIVPTKLQLDEIANITLELQSLISEPYEVCQQKVFCSCGLGVSLYPNDGDNASTLMTQAEIALHHAKALGKNQVQFYAPQLNAQAVHYLNMKSELKEALAHECFVLFFQPIVDTHSNRVISFEALLRWHRNHNDLITPNQFIDLLEDDSSLIIPVGEWVIKKAGATLKMLREHGYSDMVISVNVAAAQFMDTTFLSRVRHILKEHHIPANGIKLELTERALIKDVENTAKTLEELKALGVGIAIDDFGVGCSALMYLKKFPIDTLKIDRSFTLDIPADEGDQALVDAIHALGKSLGMQVVAEGVETSSQLEYLTQLGCHHIQGYFFAKPMPEQFLLPFLTDFTANDTPTSSQNEK